MVESRNYIATPPGETIKEQLEFRGMTQKEFAGRMDMSEKHISRLINGTVHLTPDVAERLELVLGVPADFWNRLEAIYREKLAKAVRENKMKEELRWLRKFPYKELSDFDIVPETKDRNERIINLCKFFEVTSLSLVEKKQLQPIACRKLSDTDKSFYAMLTLAQYAKLKARDISLEPFSKKKLQERLEEMRKLTCHETMDMAIELQEVFRSCGVALIYLPHLAGSFLHGITFEDNNKIIIGITFRSHDADRFWFSLFHEIAHILLSHIYQSEGASEEDEKDANRKAQDLLIPPEKLQKFYEKNCFTLESIRTFAAKTGIGFSIVLGRLQHDGKLTFQCFNQYRAKYDGNDHRILAERPIT